MNFRKFSSLLLAAALMTACAGSNQTLFSASQSNLQANRFNNDLDIPSNTDDRLLSLSFTELRSARVEKAFLPAPMMACRIDSNCEMPPPASIVRVFISGQGTLNIEGLKAPTVLEDLVLDYNLSTEGGRKCFEIAVNALASNSAFHISGYGYNADAGTGVIEGGGGVVSSSSLRAIDDTVIDIGRDQLVSQRSVSLQKIKNCSTDSDTF